MTIHGWIAETGSPSLSLPLPTLYAISLYSSCVKRQELFTFFFNGITCTDLECGSGTLWRCEARLQQAVCARSLSLSLSLRTLLPAIKVENIYQIRRDMKPVT